jgi:virginiamycin A acetyltransferase
MPPYAIVGGNPAQVIRTRFDPDTVVRLLRIAWWDWPPDRVTAAIPLISQADVDALETIAGQGSAALGE